MEELANQTTDGSVPQPKRNRGWFKAGDHRINWEGRPRGSKLRAAGNEAFCATSADRVMLLIVRERVLAHRLTNHNSLWVRNLPTDFQIVACRKHPTRDYFILVVRSEDFPRIAKGAIIPRFEPSLDGQRWIRW
jgi:hypothetical protein